MHKWATYELKSALEQLVDVLTKPTNPGNAEILNYANCAHNV